MKNFKTILWVGKALVGARLRHENLFARGLVICSLHKGWREGGSKYQTNVYDLAGSLEELIRIYQPHLFVLKDSGGLDPVPQLTGHNRESAKKA